MADTEKQVTIVIDPGHTTGYNKFKVNGHTYSEGDQMFRLGELLLQECKALGLRPWRTRCLTTQDPLLTQRGRVAGQQKAKCFISLHSNAGPQQASGTEVFYSVNANKDTTKLANKLQNSVLSVLGTVNRGIKQKPSTTSPKRDYYTVIDAAVQSGCNAAFIIETAFHTNPTDAKKLISDDYLRKLARSIALVLADHYKVTKVSLVEPIVPDSKVKIKLNSTYGGSALGKKIPDSVISRVHTVSKIQRNNNQSEALLKEITSWVPVKYLEKVDR